MAWQFLQHYLFSKRASSFIRTMSWLCILGVAIGVASLITVVSVMNGFNNSMRDNLLKAEPHLSLFHKDITHNSQELTRISEEIKNRVGNQIDSISHFEQQDVIVRTQGGEFGGAIAKGIDPETLSRLLKRITHKKWSPHILSFTKHWDSGDILMGSNLAQSLSLYSGDQVTLLPPDLLVLPKQSLPPMKKMSLSGVLSTEMERFDRQTILYNRNYPLSPFIKASSLEKGIDIWLKNPDHASQMKKQLYGLGKIETWEERNKALLLAIQVEKIAISTLLSLGTLIASFSIVTTLALLLTQKRADIGLLMALGLSRQKTQWVFMKIGMFLSMIGLGSGLLLGLLVSSFFVFTSFEVLPSDVYYEPSIPAQITVHSIISILIGSVIIAFFASWLPVRFHIDKNLSTIWRQSL